LGVVDLTPTIEQSAAKLLAASRNDLQYTGEFYPKDQVHAALAYWRIRETA